MTKETGGPAFPIIHPPVEGVTNGGVESYGITLRDYFAAKAMQGLIAKYSHQSDIARNAYAIADAMLEARK